MAAMLVMLPWPQAQTVRLPYTQNFDGVSSISDLSGWRVYYSRNATWSFHNGDYLSLTSAHSGTQNLYLFSTTPGSESDIESPMFRCTRTSDNYVRVSFWYSNNAWGSDVDSLRVVLYTGSTPSKVLFRTGGTFHSWTQVTIDVDISDLNGISFQLLFLGYSNYGNGICIDDLSVNSYRVSPYAYPAEGGSVSVSSGSGTSLTLTATPTSGYHFAYWSDNSSITTNPRTITSTGGAQSYAAVFARNDNIIDTNRIITTVNPSITITASPHNSSYGKVAGGGTYRANETARLLAIPNEGYHFRRWSDGSTDNPHAVTVKGAKTYYAYFTEECNGSATSGTDTKTACDSYTWINGNTYTASTSTPTCTLTNRANCDSVVRLNLTIRNGTHTSSSVTACDYYTWHGIEYRDSGAKTYNYTNSYGCASTETLNLTIRNSSHNTITASACDSYSWNGSTYTTSGTKTYRYTNSYNCSSVDTLHLTIRSSTNEFFNNTAINRYTWHGTTYTSSGTYTESYTNVNGCPSTATLNLTITLPQGALSGLFSVSETTQVRFSKGNLQWTSTGTHAVNGGGTEAGTWRFSEHQYDIIGSPSQAATTTSPQFLYPGNVSGSDNAYISSSYTGWIDLFTWGTSGWNSGSIEYQPYSTLPNAVGYCPGDSYRTSLVGEYANADWGVYNAISNGGNAPNQWRTLTGGTHGEWYYLLERRSASTVNGTANARYALIRVYNGSQYIPGLLIFPDEFTWPSTAGTVRPSAINNTISSWSDAPYYNLTQFTALEIAGCVFLPATGQRVVTDIDKVGYSGGYWSSTFCDNYTAYSAFFFYGNVVVYAGSTRGHGISVRLVQDY